MGWFGKPGAQELIAQGIELLDRGQLGPAYGKMEAAADAEPTSATPLAWMADIVARVAQAEGSTSATPPHAQAHHLARSALVRDPEEPRAIAVLGRLARLRQGTIQKVSPQVGNAMLAADQLFNAQRYQEALAAYEQIMAAEPTLAEPVKRAGNCAYAGGAPHIAEAYFRKAVEIDPLDAQAHHFLADAYLRQSRTVDAARAVLASITANPAYYPAWRVLQTIHTGRGRPLRRFRLQPAATIAPGDDGKPTITIWEKLVAGNAEAAAWVIYASIKSDPRPHGMADDASPLAIELRAYRGAIELVHNTKDLPPHEHSSPGMTMLRQLGAIDAEGDLATALLLLVYDESFRDELEALKRERPSACADFVNRYGLTPL